MELHVLDVPSTLHLSREELVQLPPGFAGLDVPLLQGVLWEEQREEELLVHLQTASGFLDLTTAQILHLVLLSC